MDTNVVKSQRLGRELESDGLSLASGNGYTLESYQLLVVSHHTRYNV
jgi:hypothetical protein